MSEVEISLDVSFLSIFDAWAGVVLIVVPGSGRGGEWGSKLGDVGVHFLKEVDDARIAILGKRLVHNGYNKCRINKFKH